MARAGARSASRPTASWEDTRLRALGDQRHLSADVVLVDFDERLLADATGEQLTRALIAQGLAPNCHAYNTREGAGVADVAVQSIAVSWTLHDGRLQPPQDRGSDGYPLKMWADADVAWRKLTTLSPAEQRSRIAELHAAALSCSGYDLLPVLAGKAPR